MRRVGVWYTTKQRENDRYPRRQMVATGGETAGDKIRQKLL